MRARFSFSTADLAVGLLTSIFGAIAARFVWQPVLASFADDSVSYLVMAQVFSPWQAAIPPVAEAFSHEAFYPPLFPALLGLLGAAHDTALAHAVTALMLAACLPLVYVLGVRWLGGKWGAAGGGLAGADEGAAAGACRRSSLRDLGAPATCGDLRRQCPDHG